MSTSNKTLLSRIGASCAHWFERFVSRDKPSQFNAWTDWDQRELTELACYNAWKDKGVQFTPEKQERMKRLQDKYDADLLRHAKHNGWHILGG